MTVETRKFFLNFRYRHLFLPLILYLIIHFLLNFARSANVRPGNIHESAGITMIFSI